MPLSEAVRWIARLTVTRDADELEWDPLYHLRSIALGKTLDVGQTQTFVRAGLLNPDGTLDPAFRDVILSAVRGEDRALHLESPFTDSLDRALAEYASAREMIVAAADLGQLDREEVRKFLSPSRFDQALEGLREGSEKARRAEEGLPDASNTPPFDPQSFAKRVMRKALPPDDPEQHPPLPQ